jgi:hypothetical protein
MAIQPAFPQETRDTAKELYISGITPDRIAISLGVKRPTIYKWARSGKWSILRNGCAAHAKIIADKPKEIADGVSDEVRRGLSNVLRAQVSTLAKSTTGISGLRNSKSEQGLAAVAKTIAETAAIVFDWGRDNKPGVLIVSGATPSIDVQATSKVIAEPQPPTDKHAFPEPKSGTDPQSPLPGGG